MDTNVIMILIGCATLLALAAIICDSIVERKMTNLPETLLSKKIIKVHRNYIVGFLGFAIIMLLTAHYGGPNNGIYEYLSFGSTITSLVLSILAIFVTVRSSSDLNKQFSTISKVSNQIDSTLKNLTDAETQLKNTSSEISCQMDNIVAEVEKRLDVRLQKTENAISEQIQKQNLETQSVKIDETTNINLDPMPFLENMSYSGLWTLYACSRGFETKNKFIIEDLFKDNQQYCLGVIISTRAIGFISADVFLSNNHHTVDCTASCIKSEDVYSVLQASNREDDQTREKKKIDGFFPKK